MGCGSMALAWQPLTWAQPQPVVVGCRRPWVEIDVWRSFDKVVLERRTGSVVLLNEPAFAEHCKIRMRMYMWVYKRWLHNFSQTGVHFH